MAINVSSEETLLRGIKYHCDEADAAICELGDILSVKIVPFDEHDEVSIEDPSNQLENLVRFCRTVVLDTMGWASDILEVIDPNNPDYKPEETPQESLLKAVFAPFIRKKPDNEDTVKEQNEIERSYFLEAANDLKALWTAELWEGNFPTSIMQVLSMADDTTFDRSITSHSGNLCRDLEEKLPAAVISIQKLIGDLDVDQLSKILEKKSTVELEFEPLDIHMRVSETRRQMKLLRHQEAVQNLKHMLFVKLSDFGNFSPDKGLFAEIIDELLADDQVPDRVPTAFEFIAQLDKIKATIVDEDQRMELYACFRALSKAHYHKVAFICGIPPDKVDVGMIM